MNATQLADRLEQGHTVFNGTAAAMLRKQDAAIKTLRKALESIKQMSYTASAQEKVATAALAATEET